MDAEEAIEFQCQPMISNNSENKIILKEFKMFNIVNVPVHLTDLTQLMTLLILILLHTISKIGMYGFIDFVTLNSGKWQGDIRTKTPCCSILIWTSFRFLQVNQKKSFLNGFF